MSNTWLPYNPPPLLYNAPPPPTPPPATVTGLFPAIVVPSKSRLPPLVSVIELADPSVPAAVCTVPPLMLTGPVSVPATPTTNVLLPVFTKPPAPLICPGPVKLKSFTLDATVISPGDTVPATVTTVGTPD